MDVLVVSTRKIKESETEIEKEANTLITKVTAVDADIATYKKNVKSRIENTTYTLNWYAQKITELLLWIAIGSIAIFVIVEAVFGTSLGTTYSVIITFILLSLFFYLIYRHIPVVDISSNDSNTVAIERGIEESKAAAGNAISIVKRLVPQVDAILSEAEKQKQWKSFAESLKNATKLYGLKTGEVIQGWSMWSDEPNSWLEEASDKLSSDLSINKLIIMLSYYEYTDQTGDCKNTWLKIRANPEVLKEFILNLLKNRYVKLLGNEVVNYKTNVPAIVRLVSDNETFSLEEFDRLIYDLYRDLLKQKYRILERLRLYQFPFANTEDFISSTLMFMPRSKDRASWTEDIIEAIGKETGTDANLIRVFALPDGEISGQSPFDAIKKDTGLSSSFTNILIKNGLIAVPTTYSNNQNVNVQLLKIVKSLPSFNLDAISNSFNERLNDIDTTKRLFLKVINDYRLSPLDKKNDISKFFPNDDPPEGIAEYLSAVCGIEKDILLLLYFEYSNNQNNAQILFDKITKEPSKTRKLAEAILKTGTIALPETTDKNMTTDAISAMLKVYTKFNVQTLALDIPHFDEFLRYSKGISNFLYDEGFGKSRVDVPITKLSELFKTHTSVQERYEKLKSLCNYILKQTNHTSYEEDLINPIIVSILAVYLTNKEGDINSLHACKDAGSIDIASKILYQYIYLKEKSRNDRNSRVQLKDIIKNTIDEQYSDYSHLEAFKSELINGRLPIAISQLLSNKFDALTEQVNKISETFSQNFDNLKDKIKEFLHSKLNKVTIDQSLESKIFSAYLISSSEGKALGLLDKYLSRAINDLDGRNGIYSSNILLSVEEKTVAGKGTRVGVVPPNQNFNQVMKLLENVFEKVRELANESNPLAYTIVKIDPSQTTFKHLAFNTTTTFDPSDIIKTLIIDKFSPLLNMSLMAINSSNPLENVVMVDLIKEFFNTQTTLYLLISDNLVGLSTKSLTYMKNRNLDTALLTRYQASSLCDLAYKMYSSNKNLGEEKTKKNLSNAIKESFVESQITISEDELTTLTSQIFSKLENIATIIQLS